MGYVTVEEMRAEGVTTQMCADERLQGIIDTWSQFIDQRTRQWFDSRDLDITLDGNDTPILHLGVPIISLTELYINGSTTPADPSTYKVYSSNTIPDDRRNPKVRLLTQRRTLFDVPGIGLAGRGPMFAKGQKQRLVGSFGFVEGEGEATTPPMLIKRAVTKMVAKNVTPLLSGGVLSRPSVVMSESTDGHSITYGMPTSLGIKPGSVGITGDVEVEQIISMYRAPLAMAVPGSMDTVNG